MKRVRSAIFCGVLYLAFVLHAAPAYAIDPADLAEDLAALVAEGKGVLMPNLAAPHVEDRGVMELVGDFPASFLAGLVPVEEHGVTVYPVAIRIDETTGNAVFFNAAETPFYTVPRVAPVNWFALLHPLLATNPWFAESRVVAQWTLVPSESLDAYFAAAKAPPPPLRSLPAPAGLEITNLMFTAITMSESNVVLEVAWPTNDIPDGEPLDLYFSPELATNVWTLLDSATPTDPTNVTFTVDGADLPGFIRDTTPHIHDASCIPITNIVQSVFLTGEVETNIVYSCATNPAPPGAAGFFRVGTRHDSDGDGLPDAYESLVSGTDPHLGDTDGDGLRDDTELDAETNPCLADTDGDGLGDGDETGFVQRHAEFLWFDASGGTNLLAGFATDIADRIWTVPLPSSIQTGFGTFDRLSVDLDGAFHLLSPQSPTIPSSVTPYVNFASWKPSSAATNEILFAVHAADLKAFATNAPQILVAGVASNQATVIEWRNVAHRFDGAPATFQAALLPEFPDRVFFSYQEFPTGMIARAATVGAQDRRRHSFSSPTTYQNVAWARGTPGTVTNGMTLVVCAGTGTSPLHSDTDGDGLGDGDELGVHHTDPIMMDTDGDGISDGGEVAATLNPLSPDTDGDGMPDGWEIAHGLAPLDAGDAATDLDSDGLSNLREYEEAANPELQDSDDDGIPDANEVSHARMRGLWTIPWFDLPNDAVLTPTNEVDDAVYSFSLAEPMSFCGVLCTNLLADINGLVTFPATARNGSHSSRNSNYDLLESTIWQHDCAVAAYWDDLKLRPEQGSAILAANVETNGETYCVVEYRHVGFYGAGGGSVTFQVSFAYGSPTNAVNVRYGDVTDPRQGSSATFGIQGPNRFTVRQLSNNATNTVTQSVAHYLFGTGSRPYAVDTDSDGLEDAEEVALGTNPHLADTDGDSLPDAWEVANGLNPVSAVGDDGWSGDPDGDGRSNGSEHSYGSSPVLCDTDGDGIPDGYSGSNWSNHVLRASVAGATNLLVSYSATMPEGASCALRIGTLTIPLSGSGTLALFLDPGTAYAFRLASTGGASAALSLQPPDAPPMRSGENGANGGFFLRDPSGVFGGTFKTSGEGTFGFLQLELIPVMTPSGNCVHEIPGIRTYRLSILPTTIFWSDIANNLTVSGFADHNDGTYSLFVADIPGQTASGTIMWTSDIPLFLPISLEKVIHRCQFPSLGECTLCGESHETDGLSVAMESNRIITSVYETGRLEIALDTAYTSGEMEFRIEPEVEGGARLHLTESDSSPQVLMVATSGVWISPGIHPGRYSVIASHPVASDVCATTEVYVVECVIHVNDTPYNGDDVVCRYSTNPAERPTIRCRAYIDGWPQDQEDPEVVFSCSKLRFPNEANTSLQLALEADGSESLFLISGQSASETMGDAVLEARIPDENNLLICARNVTVLWVDSFSIRSENDTFFSDDNTSDWKPAPPRLGRQVLLASPTEPTVAHVVELRAEIHPQDFLDKPNLDRDCVGYFSARSIGSSEVQTDKFADNVSRGNGHGNDTTAEKLRYDNGNLDGVLFDIDTPGFRIGPTQPAKANDPDTVFYLRENFLEFASYNGTRCSDDYPWHARITARKTAPVGQDAYQFDDPNGFLLDNEAGPGHTSLTVSKGE